MPSYEEYEYIEAILIKAVTEKSHDPGVRALFDNADQNYRLASAGMTDAGERSMENQLAVGGRCQPDGIYFAVETFVAGVEPSFSKWHPLPRENSMVIARLLHDVGQQVWTILANRQVLAQFL